MKDDGRKIFVDTEANERGRRPERICRTGWGTADDIDPATPDIENIFVLTLLLRLELK